MAFAVTVAGDVMRLRSMVWLNGAGFVLSAVLFYVAYTVSAPSRALLVGVATSFVFLTLKNLLTMGQRRLFDRRRTSFFGAALAHGPRIFAYPDFEPHEEVAAALRDAGIPMRYQRPGSELRALADFWIDVPFAAASNDIDAVLSLAEVFGDFGMGQNRMMSDRSVADVGDCAFISVGLWSSACTYMYLERAGADALFKLLPETGGRAAVKFARTRDGRDFHSDEHNEYGLIVRHSPEPLHCPERRWFIVGGLGPQGTIGAGWYLANHWRFLASRIPGDRDFVAFVKVPVVAPRSAHLHPDDIIVAPSSTPQGNP